MSRADPIEDLTPLNLAYHSIAEDENRPGLYKEYAPDFFDLIIIDECHRGSSRKESNWREILEYFKPAVQIGMTATPLRKDNKATYCYFGNPVLQYSHRQGLDNGFLAPYRVHRIVTSAPSDCRELATRPPFSHSLAKISARHFAPSS